MATHPSEPTAQASPRAVDLIMFMGQSNMAGRGITTPEHPEGAPAALPGVGWEYRAVTAPDRLSPLAEPFGVKENRASGIDDGTMKTGSMATAFVNALAPLTGTPVVGVSASKGGSRIDKWQPGGRYLTDAIRRLHAADAFLAGQGIAVRHRLMLWCQGESDGDVATPPAVYRERFDRMLGAMRTAGIEHCLLVLIGRYNGANPTVDYAPIRAEQRAIAADDPRVTLVATGFEGMKARGLMKDDFHYVQQAYDEVGAEAARNTAAWLDSGR